MSLTEIGFGAATLGNLYQTISDDEASLAVDKAWELGIRYFDTAPHYGLGLSERRLGAALRRYPRDEYVISTKIGRLIVDNEHPTAKDDQGFDVAGDKRRVWDFSPAGIHKSIDQSLERLGLDRIDIVFSHDPDQGPAGASDFAAEALISLREQGIVRAVGVGSNSAEEVASTFMNHDIDVAMLAGRYTLLEQDSIESAIRAATEKGKSIVAAGVFNSGILAQATPAPTAHYNYLPVDQERLRRATAIAETCNRLNTSLPAAAIAFPLLHPTVANVTLGMRDATQVAENIRLYENGVPRTLWGQLVAQELVRSDSVAS